MASGEGEGCVEELFPSPHGMGAEKGAKNRKKTVLTALAAN